MSQIVEIVSETSPTKNLGEYSDIQALHAHFCPNFQPIYHIFPITDKNEAAKTLLVVVKWMRKYRLGGYRVVYFSAIIFERTLGGVV